MTNANKRKIMEAVDTVYRSTNNECFDELEVRFNYLTTGYFGYICENVITISRSIRKGDLTYKLYTKHDTKPLMTIFGCWPTQFVSDVFIRALEHFYDDYS